MFENMDRESAASISAMQSSLFNCSIADSLFKCAFCLLWLFKYRHVLKQ